ncbi:Origin of replication complex subunit 6 [Coemansia helicoidea]|uniref:Origin of replication complex subunit 6 n=1 Tax=Coemansia helicoidea TaxID=1286919 RepID=A0ACC1KXM6_9FUNG|nr:Origin of replication complex subunit 6 [Coemansia helicoidea]
MSGILGEYLGKLQLDDAPGVASKAAQFFDQLGQRLSGARHGALAQCRPTIAIHLACESLSTEFNEVAARSVSSMSLAAYQACLKEARVLLNIRKHVTLEELDVQFGPPAGIIDCARQLLGEFERTLGGSMPAAVRRNMNWADSAYVAGAFFLVCKHFKKRVVAKADLLAVAAVKPAVFSTAVDKLTQFGKATLADIDQGRVAAPKTPGKRRRESQPEPPAAATPMPTPRGRRAAAAAAAPATTPPAELDSVSRKRVRRTANASPPGTERRLRQGPLPLLLLLSSGPRLLPRHRWRESVGGRG